MAYLGRGGYYSRILRCAWDLQDVYQMTVKGFRLP